MEEKEQFTDEEKLKILVNFTKNLMENQVDISPEFAKTINDHYDDILL